MRILVIVLALLLSTATLAQTTVLRDVPRDAPRGYLTHLHENILSLDGKPIRLAPGGLIRGTNNLIVLPTALPAKSLVKYQLDRNGDIAVAWILTAQEAAQPDPGKRQATPSQRAPLTAPVQPK
jgi:hypothetical protein